MSMTKITEVTVGVGGSTLISFNNIPQTFTDLYLVRSMRSDSTAGAAMSANITFNGSSSGYSEKLFYNNTSGGVASGSRTGSFLDWAGLTPAAGTGNTASTFGSGTMYIPNYTSTTAKTISSDSAQEANTSSGSYWSFYSVAAAWSGTDAITSIAITSSSGNFVAGSVVSLYGISKVPTGGRTAKATGGDIYQTGAYTYHVFKSSGTFTPSSTVSAETLIIAGGGGGGSEIAGGGGAGGFVANTQTLNAATAYSVVVGAGGAGAGYTSGGSTGSVGANSSLNSFTVIGGGGGGGNTTNASSGGSGGGSGQGTGFGAGTAGQGFAGGAANETGGAYGGGGGGGATAVGVDGTSSVGGNGGAGLTAYTSWASVTSTGASGYYAGGGGGSVYNTGTGGSGTAGGGSGGKYSPQVAGTAASANTGSGGGGGYSGAAGGSGIVIIRYA